MQRKQGGIITEIKGGGRSRTGGVFPLVFRREGIFPILGQSARLPFGFVERPNFAGFRILGLAHHVDRVAFVIFQAFSVPIACPLPECDFIFGNPKPLSDAYRSLLFIRVTTRLAFRTPGNLPSRWTPTKHHAPAVHPLIPGLLSRSKLIG